MRWSTIWQALIVYTKAIARIGQHICAHQLYEAYQSEARMPQVPRLRSSPRPLRTEIRPKISRCVAGKKRLPTASWTKAADSGRRVIASPEKLARAIRIESAGPQGSRASARAVEAANAAVGKRGGPDGRIASGPPSRSDGPDATRLAASHRMLGVELPLARCSFDYHFGWTRRSVTTSRGFEDRCYQRKADASALPFFAHEISAEPSG